MGKRQERLCSWDPGGGGGGVGGVLPLRAKGSCGLGPGASGVGSEGRVPAYKRTLNRYLLSKLSGSMTLGFHLLGILKSIMF